MGVCNIFNNKWWRYVSEFIIMKYYVFEMWMFYVGLFDYKWSLKSVGFFLFFIFVFVIYVIYCLFFCSKFKVYDVVCISCLWYFYEIFKVVICGWDGFIKYWDWVILVFLSLSYYFLSVCSEFWGKWKFCLVNGKMYKW